MVQLCRLERVSVYGWVAGGAERCVLELLERV